MLDCKASDWPILYLGLPLGGSPKACGFWDPVIERISRRLDGWQKTYLSFGGRITLIHFCLTHMLSYFLSLFKIPASVATKIERLQRDFLWSGVGEGKRDHLVSWDVVCNPKAKGELGFGKISLKNLALLGKWLWRYPREGSTKMDGVPPRSIFDMMFINYKGFGLSKRRIVLWQAVCIALIWVVWRERNARIFEDKTRNLENLWDSIHFVASLWAFCSKVFKRIPFNVLQLD